MHYVPRVSSLGSYKPEWALVAGVVVRFIVKLKSDKFTLRLPSVLRVIGVFGCEIHLSGLQLSPPM